MNVNQIVTGVLSLVLVAGFARGRLRRSFRRPVRGSRASRRGEMYDRGLQYLGDDAVGKRRLAGGGRRETARARPGWG